MGGRSVRERSTVKKFLKNVVPWALCMAKKAKKAIAGAVGGAVASAAVWLSNHFHIDLPWSPLAIAVAVGAAVGWLIVYFAPKNRQC